MLAPWVTGLASLAAGACGGVLSGMFGIGGGVVLIPLLGLSLGLNQHQAQGLTLAAMLLPNGLPAVLHFRRQGVRVPWILVAQLTAGFIPAVWAGARIANLIPDTPLRWGFALLILGLAVQTLLARPVSPAPRTGDHALDLAAPALDALAIGIAGGLASGLLGIGGGLVVIPLMVWRLHFTQHEAQAASLTLMLAPIGLPGVWVYAHSGAGFLWIPVAGVAFGFMSGAYAGARMATRIRGPRLRQAFAVLMGMMAVLLVMRDF
jgi:uncharacterized membrane protein YfcA